MTYSGGGQNSEGNFTLWFFEFFADSPAPKALGAGVTGVFGGFFGFF